MVSAQVRRHGGIGRRTGLLGTGLVLGGLAGGAGVLSAQEAEIPYDYDAAVAQAGIEGTYGYFRAIDGSVTVIQTGTNERIRVEVNEPILVGDRVFLAGGSRAELVLADRNLVRIGDQAELSFRALANSGDTDDPSSVLDLTRGTLQLVVVGDQIGRDYPSVVTPNASVSPRAAGSLLIVVDDDRRTEVVVREGRAEVYTDAEAAEVRPGESLFVEGTRGQNLEFAAAPSLDRLERWGNDLADYGAGDYAQYVDSDLHYAASSLRGHGSWVSVSAGYAWRPYVKTGWAPYRHGRWRYTPTGLFWVSYEPWGWAPYHYGYWDRDPYYGWLWYPGTRFLGAHVYWYWGPTYAGWVPTGYYWRHYGRHYGGRFGFYFGVYGHIGGGFDHYRHWTFLPHGRLGHRRQYFYSVGGGDLGRRRSALERGVLFTDTRSLRPDRWRRPNDALSDLRRIGSRDGRVLRDANAFVERSPRLPRELERVTLTGRDGRSAGGAVRPGPGEANAQRPNATTRSLEGRSQRLERPGVQGRATGRDARVQTDPGAGRERAEALRRPTSRSAPAGVQRPTSRPELDRRGTVTRPSARSPATGDGSSRTLQRPERPVTRQGTPRPSARPQAQDPGRRPTVQRGGESSRPVARPAPTGSSRPTVRRSGGASSRPAARSAPSSSSRPTVRRSGGASSRPAARPAPSSSSRPTVRRSGGASSRPAARPAPSSSSRPTVRRSGASGRPSVGRSSGGSRSSSGRRGGRARGRSGG